MTWGQFFDLVVRYRRACREFAARRSETTAASRDELGRQVDQLVATQLAWLATHEQQGQKFPTLAKSTTFGGFRDLVAIHRYASHAFERELTQNRLQDRDDSGWSIDEMIRERQRRTQTAGTHAPASIGPDLFAGVDAAGAEEPAAKIGGEA